LRNSVSREIRNAKRKYEFKLGVRIKDDPKAFYAYVNSKSRGRSKVGPLQDAQGKLVEDIIGV